MKSKGISRCRASAKWCVLALLHACVLSVVSTPTYIRYPPPQAMNAFIDAYEHQGLEGKKDDEVPMFHEWATVQPVSTLPSCTNTLRVTFPCVLTDLPTLLFRAWSASRARSGPRNTGSFTLPRRRCRSLAAARALSWKTRRTFSSVRCSATTLRVAPTVCSQRAPSLFRSWRVPIEKRAHGRRRHRADDRRILHSFAWRHGKRCAIRCCASAICSDAASASYRSPCSTRPTSRFSQAISSSGRSTPRRSRRRPRSVRARVLAESALRRPPSRTLQRL